MLKAAGILFVFAAFSLAGYLRAIGAKRELSAKRRLLTEIVNSKVYIMSERRHASLIKKRLSELLSEIGDSQFRAVVLELVEKLGATPSEGQLLMFDGCEKRLEMLLSDADKKTAVYFKLNASLGVLAGALAAVILV